MINNTSSFSVISQLLSRQNFFQGDAEMVRNLMEVTWMDEEFMVAYTPVNRAEAILEVLRGYECNVSGKAALDLASNNP